MSLIISEAIEYKIFEKFNALEILLAFILFTIVVIAGIMFLRVSSRKISEMKNGTWWSFADEIEVKIINMRIDELV